MKSLPSIDNDPMKTTSYIILDHFKPYHIELFAESESLIYAEDNSIVDTSKINFIIEMVHSDFIWDIEENQEFLLLQNVVDDLNIEDTFEILEGP